MPGTVTTPTPGYFYGVTDVMIAFMTTPDSSATPPVYGKPQVLGKSIEIGLKPRYREGRLDASNTVVRRKKKIDGYDVSLNLDDISASLQNQMFARTVDASGVQILTGQSDPAKCALGLCFTRDNGHREMWWLYKGEFYEAEKSGKTDGEKMEYQTPKVEGAFDRRLNDNRLCAIADEDSAGLAANVAANFFNAVYEDSPAPAI
ncbi:MAG: hypothetical protein RSE23_01820 [Clostridia bacterium]